MKKEHLEDVEADSEKEQNLQTLLADSYLENKFESKWKPAKLQLINNKTLEEDYAEKKQDLLIRGRKEHELEDHFGYVVENNVAALQLAVSAGLQTRDSEYNALGYNRMGIYLCKHADVCLQHALVKYSGSQVIRMLICKYIPGKHTTAIPRVASASEFIEPTQGFDAHQSVIPPNPAESLQNQFDRSQVYMYEINKLLQPAPRPRQVQPYAIVSYTLDGVYHPSIDAEPTPAEKLAGNPRLQSIVKAINSKGDGPPTPGTSPGIPPGVPNGGGLLDPMGRPSPANSLSPVGSIASSDGAPVINPELAAKYGLNGLVKIATLPGQNGAFGDGNNPALSRIVSQINARLQAEERSKKSTGPEILTGNMTPPGLATPPVANGALNGSNTPNPVCPLGPAVANGMRASLPPHNMATPSPLAPLALPNSAMLPHAQTLPGQPQIQNGFLPPGFGLSPGMKPTHAAAYPAAGLLGSLPATIPRSLPLTASRPFSPDVTQGGYNPHLLATTTGVASTGTPLYVHSQLANPTYLHSQGGLFLQPQAAPFTLDPNAFPNKDFPLYPGAFSGAMAGNPLGMMGGAMAGGTLLTGFQKDKPAFPPGAGYYTLPSSAIGQNMLFGQVSQPLKRSLSDAVQIADKRPKYY